MIIVFDFVKAHTVTFFLIKNDKVLKSKTLKLPTKLSETIWDELPKWLQTPLKGSMKLTAVAVRYSSGNVSYSTLRTILTIMNTLSIINCIPLIRLTSISQNKKIIIKELNHKLSQKKYHTKLIPEYNK